MASSTSLFLSIDEDQIGDTERNHTREQVGYAVFAGPVVYPVPACTSDLDCDDGALCNGVETCDVPSGTCQAGMPVDCNDGVGCTVDSCNEGTDSCDNIPNDTNCDDGEFCNGAETCDPFSDCQAGTEPCLPGETCNEVDDICEPGGPPADLEWGNVTVGGTPVTVNLTGSYSSPVIVATLQYLNSHHPTVTRISNVTSSSFDIRLQLAHSSESPVAENVSYLVVEEGDHVVDGVAISASTYNSTVTDENSSWIGQAQSYGQAFTNPVVVGQVMSSNDADWSVFWNQGSSRSRPPSSSVLRTGKTVCEDTDVTRADETVGIIVFEAGHGTIGGVEFEAALGADTVLGVGNSPPYAYTFSTGFGSEPTVGIVTMAGVDGGNGGWAYVYGPTLATTTSLNLAIDEDTIGDAERRHTTEQVGYVVFSSPGSAQ